MESVIILDAAEYNACTDRISNSLQVLRDEMKSLRHQDITLMRQLININDTIRSLGKDRRSVKNRARHSHNKTMNLSASMTSTTPSSKWLTPIVRQQSVPRYCDVIRETHESTDSASSDDESCGSSLSGSMTSLSDVESSTSSMSSAIPVFQSPAYRQRSQSAQVPLNVSEGLVGEDSNFDQVLRRNVKIWKDQQEVREEDSDDSSVFEGDSEEDV